MQYITTSRNQRNRVDAAKELKKLVFFSNICVAPVLEDLKVRGGVSLGVVLGRLGCGRVEGRSFSIVWYWGRASARACGRKGWGGGGPRGGLRDTAPAACHVSMLQTDEEKKAEAEAAEQQKQLMELIRKAQVRRARWQ